MSIGAGGDTERDHNGLWVPEWPLVQGSFVTVGIREMRRSWRDEASVGLLVVRVLVGPFLLPLSEMAAWLLVLRVVSGRASGVENDVTREDWVG